MVRLAYHEKLNYHSDVKAAKVRPKSGFPQKKSDCKLGTLPLVDQ